MQRGSCRVWQPITYEQGKAGLASTVEVVFKETVLDGK